MPHTESISAASLDDALQSDLDALRAADLERRLRPISRRRGAMIETARGSLVDFSSNDYLGLATDARLAAAMARGASDQGTGAAASRLIAGDNAEHEALERTLASAFDVPAALSFSSGYAANVGAIAALVTRGDVIFADELNHASLIDGCRLSRATVHVYAHADMRALASLLEMHRASHRRAIVVTDGLFSMDGDLAPLSEIVLLARQFDAWSYVDDAHAMGVLGERGRGTAEVLGVANEIDVWVGTLGKAFGSAGAFVLGSSTLRDFLTNRARSFVFSTAPSPAQAAASRTGVEIAMADAPLRLRVREHARRLRTLLGMRGIAVLGELHAPILPVVVGDAAETMRAGAALADEGFLVGAVRPPTVPPGGSRLRIAVSAAHSLEHIDAMAAAVQRVLSR